jgi:hypothetical protein
MTLDFLGIIVSRSGCGGGGGHGGRVIPGGPISPSPFTIDGRGGGYEGQAGGSAIAVLAVNTALKISLSVFEAADGGRGGSGSDQLCYEYSLLSCNTLPSGGHGGGGAGGLSIGVLTFASDLVIDPGATPIRIGSAGLGGFSNGNPGEDGVAVKILIAN